MTDQNYAQRLEERLVAFSDDEVIKFSDMNPQLQDIARNLYERSKNGTMVASYRLDGTPNDETVFSGKILTLLSLIKDFMTGEFDDKGRIKFRTGKGEINVGFGGLGCGSFTEFEYVPQKEEN